MKTRLRLPVLSDVSANVMHGAPEVTRAVNGLVDCSKAALIEALERYSSVERAERAIPVNPKYQSLSITVPGGCPNSCKFCVSDMHEEKGIPNLLKSAKKRDELRQDVIDRLVWARKKGQTRWY
jgi:hypothetical protein